jgi:hypothetical protein
MILPCPLGGVSEIVYLHRCNAYGEAILHLIPDGLRKLVHRSFARHGVGKWHLLVSFLFVMMFTLFLGLLVLLAIAL